MIPRSVYEGEWDGVKTQKASILQRLSDTPNTTRQGAARLKTRADLATPKSTTVPTGGVPPNEDRYAGNIGPKSIDSLMRKAGVDYRSQSTREVGGDDRVAQTTDGQPSKPVGGSRPRRRSGPVSTSKQRTTRSSKAAPRTRRPRQGLDGIEAALAVEPAAREVRRRPEVGTPPAIRGTR